MALQDVTLYLFTVFNTLRLVSYIPQMIAVGRDRSGAASISCLAWLIWTAANASAAAHFYVIEAGWTVVAVNTVNAIFCLLILIQARWKQTTSKRGFVTS